MIVEEARRLQDEGKRGLQILPGVQVFLQQVSSRQLVANDQLQTSDRPAWAIVTSGE